MAFFFVKIISLSKPSGSISNTMQYLHVLELTSDATNENETCYSPWDTYPMLGTMKFTRILLNQSQ